MKGSFLAELKRRKVYRVGVGYAAVAFVVLQAAELVLPSVGVGDRGFRVLVFLTLAGFPVALALAWLFDITPTGLERTGAAQVVEPVPGKWLALWTAALVVASVVLGGTAWWVLRATPVTDSAVAAVVSELDPKSIAVMPFANLSGADEEYFSDGMTDAVITALTRVRGLSVASRTSSYALRERARSLPEISRELGVASVLEGSVRKGNGRVQVDVHLADARTGFELWTERYERPVDDVFDVQEEIAAAIVRVMEVTLAERPDPPLVVASTQDAMAYDKFLWGEYNRNKRTPQGLDDAIGNFSDALMRDPNFAPAHAGLAQTYLLKARSSNSERSALLIEAHAVVERALQLDPDLADALAAHGMILFEQYQWNEAQAELEKAIAIQPRRAWYRQLIALIYALKGDVETAKQESEEAVRLNPLSPGARADRAAILDLAGATGPAERQYRRALELERTFPDARVGLALLLLRQGRTAAALEVVELSAQDLPTSGRIASVDSDDPQSLGVDGGGDLSQIREWLRSGTPPPADSDIAAPILAAAGDFAAAARSLSEAVRTEALSPTWLLRVLAVPGFIDDPAGTKFLSDMGLPRSRSRVGDR